MARSRIAQIFVSLASAGWLVPLWFGVRSCLSFVQGDLWPVVNGGHQQNSFPLLSFAGTCFEIAFAWLGVVIVFWAYMGFAASTRKP